MCHFMQGRLTLSALFAKILEPDKEAISSEYTLLADLFWFLNDPYLVQWFCRASTMEESFSETQGWNS